MPSVRPTKLQALPRRLQTTSGGTNIAKGPGITSTPLPPPISDSEPARGSQECPMPPKKMPIINRRNINKPTAIYRLGRLGSTVVPPGSVILGPSKTTTPKGHRLIHVTGQGMIMSTDSLRHSTPNTQLLRPRKPGQPKKGEPPPNPKNMPAAMHPCEHPGFEHSQRTIHGKWLGPAVMNPYHQKMASRTHTCSRRRCISQRPFEAYKSVYGGVNPPTLILGRRKPRKFAQQNAYEED